MAGEVCGNPLARFHSGRDHSRPSDTKGLQVKTNPNDYVDVTHQRSLTKREYFSAVALQGLLSHDPHDGPYTVATRAVTMADSLILALNNLEIPQP